MLTVEVAINGSPAWLVTANRVGPVEGADEAGAHTYEVKAFDAAGLETLRMEGGEPRPLAVAEVEHVRSAGALALAAAATTALNDQSGSGELDQRLADRLAGS